MKAPVIDDTHWRKFQLVYGRLHRAFSLFVWKTQVCPLLRAHPLHDSRRSSITAIKNTCVESTLLSIRDLDDFFRPRKPNSHAGDIRACDFHGFNTPGPFLDRTERGSINERIVHLTDKAILDATTGLGNDSVFSWNAAALIEKAVQNCFLFMDHLRGLIPANDREKLDELKSVRSSFEYALEDLKKVAKQEEVQFSGTASQSLTNNPMSPEQTAQFAKFGCASRCVIKLAEMHAKPIARDEFVNRFSPMFPVGRKMCGLLGTSAIIDVCRSLELCSNAESYRSYDKVKEILGKGIATGVFLLTERDLQTADDPFFHCSLIENFLEEKWHVTIPVEDDQFESKQVSSDWLEQRYAHFLVVF